MEVYGTQRKFNIQTDLKELRGKLHPSMDTMFTEQPFNPSFIPAEYSSLKPRGFWWAKGAEWIDWLYSQSRWDKSRSLIGYVYRVNLNKRNYLMASSKDILWGLYDRYRDMETERRADDFGYINWEMFARDYTGIEFNPYFYDFGRRHEKMTWYASVEIASGCTWDPATILSLEAIS